MRESKRIVICVALICALLYFSGISAQEQPTEKPPETPPETPKAEQPLSQVYLKDGTFVVGEIKMETLKVTTDYGVLTVPKNQIVKVRIGKNADKELKKKIDDLVKQLGDSEFKVREDATKELTTLGPVALAELREATKSEDVEVKTRAEKLVRQVEQSTSSEEEVIDDDEVQTTKFTIRGIAEIESIEITTRHGVLKVLKKDIKSVVVGEATFQSKTVTVDASYWVPGAMMDSQVDVKKGDTVTITATGNIYIRSWSMSISPDGDPNNTYMSNLPMGALTGRIGTSGPLFKIGASYKGTADRDGRLFLGTAARERSGNTGEFKVKITVEK
jgi:hypothetical protein